MSVLVSQDHKSFISRALQRFAAAFSLARPAEVDRRAGAQDVVDRGWLSGQDVSVPLVTPATPATAPSSRDGLVPEAPVSAVPSLIGFAVPEGTIARLPQDFAEPKALVPSLAVDRQSLPAVEPAAPRVALFLPEVLARVPSLDDAVCPAIAGSAPAFVDGAADNSGADGDMSARPALRSGRPLAAQLASMAALNRPLARANLGGSRPTTQGKPMPKRGPAQIKRSPLKRHVALVSRSSEGLRAAAPAGDAMEAVPAVLRAAQMMAVQAPLHRAAPDMARRIDLSVPALRGALRLDREGRNIIDSLPMAA